MLHQERLQRTGSGSRFEGEVLVGLNVRSGRPGGLLSGLAGLGSSCRAEVAETACGYKGSRGVDLKLGVPRSSLGEISEAIPAF